MARFRVRLESPCSWAAAQMVTRGLRAAGQELFQESAGAVHGPAGRRTRAGQELIGGPRAGASPGQGGRAGLLGDHGVGQALLGRSQVVFHLGQNTLAGSLRVAGNEPGGPAGPDKTDGTAAPVDGVPAAALVQVTGQVDHATMPVREAHQGQQGPPDTLVVAREDRLLQESHDRIEDHQPGPGLGHGFFQEGGLRGQPEGVAAGGVLRLQAEDAAQVGPQGLEAGPDGVLVAVLAVKDERTSGREAGLSVGERTAGAEPGTRSSSISDFPRPGSPSRMASLPRASRPGQSHSRELASRQFIGRTCRVMGFPDKREGPSRKGSRRGPGPPRLERPGCLREPGLLIPKGLRVVSKSVGRAAGPHGLTPLGKWQSDSLQAAQRRRKKGVTAPGTVCQMPQKVAK